MSSKTLIGGVVGGVVLFVANFVLHGLILGGTYVKYPDVFSQDGDPIGYMWFTIICLLLGILLAIVFARTRKCWAAGIKGGIVCGLWIGVIVGVTNFFYAIVIEGWPYFLAWCHFGSDTIAFVLAGAGIAALVKGD